MNRLKLRIVQWRALEPWERSLLLRLCFLLPRAGLVLRVLGFPRALRIAQFDASVGAAQPEQLTCDYAQRCAELTGIAARHGLYKANCLHQSLVLCRLLRQHGLEAVIRIGVRPNTQPFLAHAWVELDGLALGQSVEEYGAFARLTAVPGSARFI